MNSKSEEEIKHVLNTYGDMLYRTAYVLLGNPHDVQDVLQEVFIKYMEKAPSFQLMPRLQHFLFFIKAPAEICRSFGLKS